MQTKKEAGQVSLFGRDMDAGRMYPEPFPVRQEGISRRSSKHLSGSRNHRLMLLDLRPGAGNLLGPYWEYDPHWLGPPGTLNTSESPKGGAGFSLSQILQDTVPSKYYLSKAACFGILRRAEKRGKELPPQLRKALELQAGVSTLST